MESCIADTMESIREIASAGFDISSAYAAVIRFCLRGVSTILFSCELHLASLHLLDSALIL